MVLAKFREKGALAEVLREGRAEMWRKFIDWLMMRDPPCEHEWHPTLVRLVGWNEYKPSRQCVKCKNWQPLSPEQFYAQFGESFYSMAGIKKP